MVQSKENKEQQQYHRYHPLLHQLLYFEWYPPWHLKHGCIMLNSYQVSSGWNAVAKRHQQESNLMSAYLLTLFLENVSGTSSDILSGILSGISSETLCSWGPAGNALLGSSRFRDGGEHSDPKLTVEARQRSLDPEVSVRVQMGTLRSRACSWCPAEEERRRGGRRRRACWHRI